MKKNLFLIVILSLFLNSNLSSQGEKMKISFINEMTITDKYTIKQITVKRIEYHNWSGINPVESERYCHYEIGGCGEGKIDGSVHFDTIKKTIWIETYQSEYIDNTEWVNYDLDGNVLAKVKGNKMTRNEMSKLERKNWITFQSEIIPHYNWENKNSKFYMEDFTRERFNWSSLNPLRGWGNPNGSSETPYWEVTALLNLKMEKSNIKFKSITHTTSYGFTFEIELYRIPKKYTLDEEIVLLYILIIVDIIII